MYRASVVRQGCGGRSSLTVICGESRIGKVPVKVPDGVQFKLKGLHLSVKVTNLKRGRSMKLRFLGAFGGIGAGVSE